MILLKNHESYSEIILNRPDKKNALNQELVLTFLKNLDDIEKSSASYIVIRGAGGNFCSGIDLNDDFKTLYPLVKKLFLRVYNFPKPIMSYVEGYCLAGGVGLVAACDLSYASETAQFGLPEIKKGLIPSLVMALLHRQINPRHLSELALSGECISAKRAYEIGLINGLSEPIKLPPIQEIARIKKLSRLFAGPIEEDLELAFNSQVKRS